MPECGRITTRRSSGKWRAAAARRKNNVWSKVSAEVCPDRPGGGKRQKRHVLEGDCQSGRDGRRQYPVSCDVRSDDSTDRGRISAQRSACAGGAWDICTPVLFNA